MLKVILFLTEFDVYILPTLFVLVWLFGVANWCCDVYRKQNKKLLRCRVGLQKNAKWACIYLQAVPSEYARQWRAFVNSGAARPSIVFEFVPRKNKIVCKHLLALCALCCLAYLLLFVLGIAQKNEYVVFQAAFWLAVAVVLILNKLLFEKKEKRARQEFARFVAQLNALKSANVGAMPPTAVSEKLREMKAKSAVVDDITLEKASAMLRQCGLEERRSVEEQRKINHALNGLLQAYSRNAIYGSRI